MSSAYFGFFLQGLVVAVAGCVHAAALASSDLPAWFGCGWMPAMWIAGGAYLSWLGLGEVAT